MPAPPSHFPEQEAGHSDKTNTSFLQGHTFRREPAWAANPGLLDPRTQLPLSGCGLRRKNCRSGGMTRQPEGACPPLEPQGQNQGELLSWMLQRQSLLRVTGRGQESRQTALLCDLVGLTSAMALRPGRDSRSSAVLTRSPAPGVCLQALQHPSPGAVSVCALA